MHAKARTGFSQVQRQRRGIEAGAEPGEPLVERDQLGQQRIVHFGRKAAGKQLLHDPAVAGQLVFGRRDAGRAGRARPPGVRLHPGRLPPNPYYAVVDLSAFYAVVSGINFTLLGLWWVAVRERSEIGADSAFGRRMAYLVSLQFVIPGTVSLLSQVAPDVPALWRSSFTAAGIAGAAGSAMLAGSLGRIGQGIVAALIGFVAAPLYLIVALVAAIPPLTSGGWLAITPLQLEGVLLCLLVFLGVHAAWVVAMAPRPAQAAADRA